MAGARPPTQARRARQEEQNPRYRPKVYGRQKTLCLTMIVKNEAKNMKRLLESLKEIIDYISIVDTGSSDNTRQVIQDWGRKSNVPTTVHREPWKNFGYNRTHSVQMAQKTYPQVDYLLLSDADFVWELHTNGKFDKRLLTLDSYMVDQYNDTLRYANARLLRAKVQWECVGVTHEFWRAVGDKAHSSGKVTTLLINDVGDGGAKADKFTRDERLLRGGIDDPNTPDDIKARYKFYLAQTLKDVGRYEESIDWYKQRVEDGGFEEEVYYALFKVGSNYEQIAKSKKWLAGQLSKQVDPSTLTTPMKRWNPNDLPETALMEEANVAYDQAKEYYQKAADRRPSRAEALYYLTKMLRERGQNKEAYQVALKGQKIPYPKEDRLFVEPAVYEYLFDHELSIVAYYVPEGRSEGQEACARLLGRKGLPEEIRSLAEHNAKFYL